MSARALSAFVLVLALGLPPNALAQVTAGSLLQQQRVHKAQQTEPPTEELAEPEPPAATEQVEPHPGKAAYQAALEAWRAGDFATVRARLEEALALEPGLASAAKGLVVLDLEQDHPAQALAGAEAILEQTPRDAQMLRALASAAGALGDLDRAGAALDQLVTLDPSPMTTILLYNDAARAWNLEQLELAERRLEQVAARDPKVGATLELLARLHAQRRDHAKTLELAERALDFDPDNRDLLEICYQAHTALGQFAEAQMVRLEIEELE